MADSENSRSLPSITRRNLIAGAITSMAASEVFPTLGKSDCDLADNPTNDPTLLLWRQWAETHESYVKAHHRQWDLGTKLCRAPLEIEIFLPSRSTPVYASTAEEIDEYLGGRPERAIACASAKTRLAAMHIEWDRADERFGYTSAVEEEKEASALRTKLAETLWKTRAQSVAAAAAKLQVFIEMRTPVEAWRKGLHPALRRLEEPSWPELRSILDDLKQLAGPDHG